MMPFLRIICLTLVLTGMCSTIIAQKTQTTSPPEPAEAALYACLYHQHHDIFGKPFSFQGLEAGILVNRALFLGVYGAFFASNLKIEINNSPQFAWMGQTGLSGSYVFWEKKRVHPGGELKLGVFTLRRDARNLGVFETAKAAYKLKGSVFSPQVFGELNALRWCKVRVGLSYNLYSFVDETVHKSDLNHLSFTFGIVFHGSH